MGRVDSPLLDRMVFVVGAQRSGTNWLQRMLGTHPRVVSLPSETHLFTARVDAMADRVQHGAIGSTATSYVYMDRDAYLDALRSFYDAAFGAVASHLAPGALRIVERSPNHVEQLDHIAEVYPDAWVLHIIRDGRDVARSLVSQALGPTSIASAAELWVRAVRAGRAAAPSLRRYREVRYEELLAEPASGLTALFEFLDLDASPTTVAAALAEAGVAYNTDVQRPDIGDGKWRSEWNAHDLAEFEGVAGSLLAELGYPRLAPQGQLTFARLRAGLRRPRWTRPMTVPPTQISMELRQRRVDALCAALASGDADAAVADLAPAALVRVVSAGQDTLGRADAGRELLAKTTATEGGGWGEQRRGDVHVAETMFAVVLSHDGPAGGHDRLVVVHFDAQSRISELALYDFPLG